MKPRRDNRAVWSGNWYCNTSGYPKEVSVIVLLIMGQCDDWHLFALTSCY